MAFNKSFANSSAVIPYSSTTGNFSVKLSTDNNKAILQWKNIEPLKTSHFVVQRSEDGANFTDAVVIFVPEQDINTIKEYRYSDKIMSIDKKVIYYRLKTVDAAGKIKYSSVILMQVGKAQGQII